MAAHLFLFPFSKTCFPLIFLAYSYLIALRGSSGAGGGLLSSYVFVRKYSNKFGISLAYS